MKTNLTFERTGDYELVIYCNDSKPITLDEDSLFSIWDMIERQKTLDAIEEYFTEQEQNFNIVDNANEIAEYFRDEKDELVANNAKLLIRLAISDLAYSVDSADYNE